MAEARKLVETGLALRAKAAIKVRQPLAKFTYDDSVIISNELEEIIADELNVKKVEKALVIDIDINITPELKEEGQVRELMRAIQEMRKDAGLSPSDYITLSIETDEAGKAILQKHSDMVTKAVQANSIEYGTVDGEEIVADGLKAKIGISK
jgi:isoleucyl-tRNA synthetase